MGPHRGRAPGGFLYSGSNWSCMGRPHLSAHVFENWAPTKAWGISFPCTAPCMSASSCVPLFFHGIGDHGRQSHWAAFSLPEMVLT